jgi:hypothetical protein
LVSDYNCLPTRGIIGSFCWELLHRENLTLRQVAMRSAVGQDHWALIGAS